MALFGQMELGHTTAVTTILAVTSTDSVDQLISARERRCSFDVNYGMAWVALIKSWRQPITKTSTSPSMQGDMAMSACISRTH